MSSERRLNARRILYSPEYLDMGDDNGGVVVNLSEGGLGFHAVGPVVPDVEIPVSFSLGPGYRIDVKARVVWVGEHGKLGGAVFGKLSKDSRSLIREWLAKPEVEHEEESEVPASETQSKADRRVAEAAAASIAATQTVPDMAAGEESTPSSAPQEPPTKHDIAGVEEFAAQNGVVLPLDVQPQAEPSPTAAFSAHEVPPSAPMSSAPVAEPVAVKAERQTVPASEAPMAPVQAEPVIAPAVLGPNAAKPKEPSSRSTRSWIPTATPSVSEAQPERAGSFSLVPSISAWNKGVAPSTERPSPQSRTAGPLFPPRNDENIFARSPSNAAAETGGRRGFALVIIALLIAAGAAIVFYARGHRQQIGNAIVHIGNSVAGTPAASATETVPAAPVNSTPASTLSNNPATAGTSPETPATQTPATSPTTDEAAKSKPTSPQHLSTSGNTPNNAPQPNAKAGTQQAQTTQTKGAVAKSQPGADASKSAPVAGSTSPALPYAGQAEYQRAENYLNGKGVDKDPAEAAEWFWRSLEAGNTGAAIPLADLYLQGNGVSRSCIQARILLDAAAQKNNPQAIQKLAQLPENCQ